MSEWQSLTDDDIWKSDDIMAANSGYGANFETLRTLVRAVEPVLREKNAKPEELNLHCKSVQARLATQWGYVKPADGGPVMDDEMIEFLEGMSISVDVSTGEHDAGHRYFGTVTEVMYAPEDKHGVTLLVQDAEPNFIKPADSEPVSDCGNKDPRGCWNVRCQLGKKCKNTQPTPAHIAALREARDALRTCSGVVHWPVIFAAIQSINTVLGDKT